MDYIVFFNGERFYAQSDEVQGVIKQKAGKLTGNIKRFWLDAFSSRLIDRANRTPGQVIFLEFQGVDHGPRIEIGLKKCVEHDTNIGLQ